MNIRKKWYNFRLERLLKKYWMMRKEKFCEFIIPTSPIILYKNQFRQTYELHGFDFSLEYYIHSVELLGNKLSKNCRCFVIRINRTRITEVFEKDRELLILILETLSEDFAKKHGIVLVDDFVEIREKYMKWRDCQ